VRFVSLVSPLDFIYKIELTVSRLFVVRAGYP